MDTHEADPAGVFHHHWLKYARPLSGLSLVLVVAVLSLWRWPHLGMGLCGVAAVWAGALYLDWRWTEFWFTPDHRLVYRRGFQGNDQDTISLFGKLSYHQIPVLGKLLDVGTVHLMVPGSAVQIEHVANFQLFHDRLVTIPQPTAQPAPPQVVPVIVLHLGMAGGGAVAPNIELPAGWQTVDQGVPRDGRPFEFGR